MLPAVANSELPAGRVAVGLAAGLGLGFGLGTAALIGLAAPASAAPADTRGHSDSAVHRGTVAPVNRAAAAVRAGAVAPAVRPRAAAATRTPAARAITPRVAAPRARATQGATQQSATDPVTSVTSFLSSLFNCDPRGRLITIYKGTHFAIPNSFGLFTQSVTGTGTFTTDTTYDLGDEDQYDWNKFTGIAFTPLEPDRNSVMVGWRYNLTTQNFEIAPFYNVDKVRVLPNETTEVIAVPPGETFSYAVDYNGVTISYGGKTVYKPFPTGLTANVWTAARVSGWFGGNEVAPRTVSYYLNLT